MVDHLILVTCFILFPQQLDLLLHSLGLLEYALNTADISFEVLVHVEFLVKLESFEGFLEFSGFCVERDSIRVQDKDVGRILHPSLVNTDLRAAPTRLIVGYFIAVGLLPIVREPTMLDVKDHWPHLLLVLGDDLFLTCLLV